MHKILIQRATKKEFSPTANQLRLWARTALTKHPSAAELTIRIVTKREITHLNSTYRHKNYATNVLSFPFDMPTDIDMEIPLLGDLVICAAVVNEEATSQQKSPDSHWAHMVIHGTLHLLGYDHENEQDAISMETTEIALLASLDIPNPYHIEKG
jgi:probable rRNA maturation factor